MYRANHTSARDGRFWAGRGLPSPANNNRPAHKRAPNAGKTRTIAVFTGMVLLLSGGLALAASAKRGMLWHVVQLCTANKQITGAAFPCVDADLSKGVEAGYVVLHAPLASPHDLVAVPTIALPGVESPFVRQSGAPNYFADAWSARRFVEENVARPLKRDEIGLALNSLPGRAQDQLHIHIDCVYQSVRKTLQANAGLFKSESWTKLPFDLAGDRYWGLRLNSPDLAGINVFRLVFDGLHVSEADSPRVTIALAGASFERTGPGFYLLAAISPDMRPSHGHSENILDHGCNES